MREIVVRSEGCNGCTFNDKVTGACIMNGKEVLAIKTGYDTDCPMKPIKLNWKEDYEVYREYIMNGFKESLEDKVFVKRLQRAHPKMDIQQTVRSAFQKYWGMPNGWEKKKKTRSKTINFKTTIVNICNLGFNAVEK